MLILDLNPHSLQCEILSGDKAGHIVFINRKELKSDKDYPFEFKRRQFPIKPAFAMTINRAQGQTLKKVGVDLRRDVFTHKQLYVAFSRVPSWTDIKVSLGDEERYVGRRVKNFIFKEIPSAN